MIKTTAKDFAIFKKHCRKWIDQLGLRDWEIEFKHEEDEGRRASVSYSVSDRTAGIVLAVYWDVKPTPEHLDKVAFHECMHLVLAPLTKVAESRWSTAKELDNEEHAVVRTMENVLFP